MTLAALDNASLLQRALARSLEVVKTDAQLKNAMPDFALSKANRRPGLRPIDILANVCEAFVGREALGHRTYDLVKEPASGQIAMRYRPAFSTITYREVWQRVQNLATAWHHHATAKVRQRDFVCILGFASTDYVITEYACLYAGATSVPLPTSMHPSDLARIIDDTHPACFVVSLENLASFAPIFLSANVPSVVVMDYESGDDSHRRTFLEVQETFKLSRAPISLTSFADLLVFGRCYSPVPNASPEPGEDPLTTLMYTSGSTARPKGAIFPESLWINLWLDTPPAVPVVAVSYTPINHAIGRSSVIRTLLRGGTCYFVAKSDMSTLFEDIRMVRPTVFDFIPRISELIHRHFQTEVLRLGGGRREVDKLLRKQIIEDMRTSFLGGRLLMGTSTTAPTAPEVAAFLRECFDIPVIDTYGSTEAGAITRENRIKRPTVIDYKLVDVPELGYCKTDKPFPRGELLVKSKHCVPGYYKNPVASAELYDKDGYLRTGDIVEEREPDHVVWLDRKNDVLKLAQGEFVTSGRLETIFQSGSILIRQIYLYGNSQRSYLLAVIVPNLLAVRDFEDHTCERPELKESLRKALNECAREAKLRAYEVPRDFLIELEPFTPENGLLTDMGKLTRSNLKSKYRGQLEELYSTLERKQLEEVAVLKGNDSETSVAERVKKALYATLGVATLDLSTGQTFAELGGDSLSSVSLSVLLGQIFGVDVPVSTILNPAGNLQTLTNHIEDRLGGRAAKYASFAGVHGAGAREIHAQDLTLERFMDAETLERVPALHTQSSYGPIQSVLLTGANGFLGRFLCLEWLAHVAPVGGKVTCIIRAPDAAAARRRLGEVFKGGDGTLQERFTALAEKHLEVLPGDLGQPRFGLGEGDYAHLAGDIDIIAHTGALVNHVLSYEQLFEPNVVGTGEIIRLALTNRLKRIEFMSSVAALMRIRDHGNVGDDVDLCTLCPTMSLGEGYAAGYGVSKWAGEVLLKKAHERFGLPVNIYRSSTILAHSTFQEQINVADMFTRLLFSIVQTGLAPASFYEPAPDGGRAQAHFNGLPVDFTARAIAQIGAQNHRGYGTFNVINTHRDDDISLDRIIDWVEAAGYGSERVKDYNTWVNRFEDKLKSLPVKLRQQSSLALMEDLRRPSLGRGGRMITGEAFHAKVRSLRIGATGDIPHLSAAFIHKCLDDMRRLGLIPAAK